MAITPLTQLLAAVPTLNDPKNPFSYEVDGDSIVGSWDIVSAKTLYPAEFDTIDKKYKKYKIIVTFDEKKNTFEFTEKKKSTEGSISSGGLSFGTSSFSGKSSSKEFSFEFGGVHKDKDGDLTAAPLVWSFETSRIKDPLFGFLKQNGWERKKSLLGGLFNR